ncbi:hypothetical protein PINS_up002831 [Pythium insidiosum]|nr:hypothetical protein PINS_up002831 [Pythium insidiosum]
MNRSPPTSIASNNSDLPANPFAISPSLSLSVPPLPLVNMRLITHNMLVCNKKGVENGFPLRIESDVVEVIESEFHADFVRKMLTKLDYAAFLQGAKSLGVADGLPEQYDAAQHSTDEELLRKVHHALLDVHVKSGKLICPESGREFPIVDGIPNMLLREDEV